MTVTASKLRIVAEPVVAERFFPDAPPGSRLSRIVKRPGLINCDPEDLVEIDWSKEWNPDDNI